MTLRLSSFDGIDPGPASSASGTSFGIGRRARADRVLERVAVAQDRLAALAGDPFQERLRLLLVLAGRQHAAAGDR